MLISGQLSHVHTVKRMPGPICSVCIHKERAAIDYRLATGEGIRSIAAAYGIPKSAVDRHKRLHAGIIGTAHKPPRPPKPVDPDKGAIRISREERRAELAELSRGTVAQALLPTAEELSAKYQSYMERLEAVISKAEEEGAAALSIQGLTAARQTVDSLAKLAGLSSGGTQVNVAVGVSISASDIASALAGHLTGGTVSPSEAANVLELTANE